MPKPKQMIGLLSFDDLDRMDAEGQIAPPVSHYYDGKYTRYDTKEAALWHLLHPTAAKFRHLFDIPSESVTDAQLLDLCSRAFGISGGRSGPRSWSIDYHGGTKPRVSFSSPGGWYERDVYSEDDLRFAGKRLADLTRSVLFGPVVKAENHYRPHKYIGAISLDGCLWDALHRYEKGGVPWPEVSPDITDDALQAMVCRVFPQSGFFQGRGWNYATKVEGDCSFFVAIDESRKRYGEYATAREVIRNIKSMHHSLYRGRTLLDLVRFVLWGPPLQTPEASLFLTRQELLRTLTSVVEHKRDEQQREMESMLLGALVRTETEYVTVEERRDWWRQCCPGFLHGIDKPFLERGGKRFVIGGTGSGPCEGGTEETFYCYEVVPESEWPHPKYNLSEKIRDESYGTRAGNWQGLRTCQFTIGGRGKRVEGDAFVLTGYVLKLVLPPDELARMLAEDKAKFWAKYKAETEAAPAPEPVPEPVTSCLPPAPLTAGGLTCTTYDAAGNHAMLSFAHAVKAAGYSDRITTGGELDAKKCCRACNALCGRVASDRPQPSVDEWCQAALLIKVKSADGFDEIDALEGLPADATT